MGPSVRIALVVIRRQSLSPVTIDALLPSYLHLVLEVNFGARPILSRFATRRSILAVTQDRLRQTTTVRLPVTATHPFRTFCLHNFLTPCLTQKRMAGSFTCRNAMHLRRIYTRLAVISYQWQSVLVPILMTLVETHVYDFARAVPRSCASPYGEPTLTAVVENGNSHTPIAFRTIRPT